jgi:UDP-N-acetyl-D-mannosaminuronate dehydrogenase
MKNSIDDAIDASDAIVIITGHKEFDNLDLEKISNSMNKPILIDCTGKINPLQAKSKGIIFRGIGRGN